MVELTSKARKCKVCKTPFQPVKAMQKVCSFGCAVDLGIAEKQKAQRQLELTVRRADKVTREKLKTRGDWIKEAQIEFNKYVRVRDAGRGCISCGSACSEGSIGGSGDAGHFRSRGSAPHLRFDERNCHLQCKRCNRYLSGNVADYRTGLVKRIGIDAVLTLEADQEPRRHTVDDLKAIKQKYAALTRELRGKE